jgi:hypothetical protein
MNQHEAETRPYTWEVLYEKAITEPDTALRRLRLQEAEEAILHRAAILDNQPDPHQTEVQALEEAADFIREMKRKTQSDGINKQIKIGQQIDLPHYRG